MTRSVWVSAPVDLFGPCRPFGENIHFIQGQGEAIEVTVKSQSSVILWLGGQALWATAAKLVVMMPKPVNVSSEAQVCTRSP